MTVDTHNSLLNRDLPGAVGAVMRVMCDIRERNKDLEVGRRVGHAITAAHLVVEPHATLVGEWHCKDGLFFSRTVDGVKIRSSTKCTDQTTPHATDKVVELSWAEWESIVMAMLHDPRSRPTLDASGRR